MLPSFRSFNPPAPGARRKAADLEGAADTLVRISQLVTDFPEIVELDVNPLTVFAAGQGVLGIDARRYKHKRENSERWQPTCTSLLLSTYSGKSSVCVGSGTAPPRTGLKVGYMKRSTSRPALRRGAQDDDVTFAQAGVRDGLAGSTDRPV